MYKEKIALSPQIPILAVTATATLDVQKDICKSLHLVNPRMTCTGFDRSAGCFLVWISFSQHVTDKWPSVSEHILWCLTIFISFNVKAHLYFGGCLNSSFQSPDLVSCLLKKFCLHCSTIQDSHLLWLTLVFGKDLR